MRLRFLLFCLTALAFASAIALFGSAASADGVIVSGALDGCGGANFTGALDSGLVTANGSAVEPGGAVSGSANLPLGALSVSETSSQGCSGFVISSFSIEGTISLPTDLPSFVGIRETGFVESNNCAVVGCGNVGGEPLAGVLFSGSLEDLVNGNTEIFNCGGQIGPESIGTAIGACIPNTLFILVGPGDEISVASSLEVGVANGAFVTALDPLELVLPPGATFVPDNSSLSFPTVTEGTTPEPSSLLLLGTGLLGLLAVARLGPFLRRRLARS